MNNYKIIIGSKTDIEERVSEMLNDGWGLVGHLTTYKDERGLIVYVQTMIRYTPKDIDKKENTL